MLTTLDIPQEDLDLLDEISEADKVSRAELVHRAITSFVASHRPATPKPNLGTSGIDAAFGMWKDRQIDGQEYQDRIRSEWDREWDR